LLLDGLIALFSQGLHLAASPTHHLFTDSRRLTALLACNMLTMVTDGYIDALGAVYGRLVFVAGCSSIGIAKVGVAEVLNNWPSIGVGKHSTDDHVVMRVRFKPDQDFTP
jgi:hypothetical protein